MKVYTFDELLHKAASYCSISEHCVSEVRAKLAAWKVESDMQEEIVCRLLDDGFIDEARFCRAYVNDKFRFDKWGKVKIMYNLRQKGLSEDDIQPALLTIDEGEYDEMLANLLRAKLLGLKYEYEYEKQGKLYKFAQGRGFESAAIERVMRRL